jgi:TetR/AcrR family transcriptional repressor of bet genes
VTAALNHDERRRAIADVAVQVIARDGLEAATVRRIAAEVGYSTTVITHYFADKDELLLWAYRTLGDYARDHYDEAIARDPRDLLGYLLSMSAVSEPGRALWRVYVAIWDRALHDAVFAGEISKWVEAGAERIAGFLRTLNPDCAEPDRGARRLIGFVQGLSIQMLFDPTSWPVAVFERAVATEIDLLLEQRRSTHDD